MIYCRLKIKVKLNKLNQFEEEDTGIENVQTSPISDKEEAELKPRDKVKVKFDKFVNLIATHAYEEIIDKHMDQDIIMGTDLLADLASATEEKSDRKIPAIFLFGILLGVIFTWILFKT